MAAMAKQRRVPDPLPEPPAIEPVATPVRLEAPYSYYEQDGTLKNWAPGQVLTDPVEIKHLQRRGAPLVPHEVES
jgi:hypothetical protein